MKTTYFDEDDILVMRFSDKPITREVSQDWDTHISYAADGTTVEIVVLDARASGALPVLRCFMEKQPEAARPRGRPVGSVKAVRKAAITLRLDSDALTRWRASGKGWQTRATAILEKHAP